MNNEELYIVCLHGVLSGVSLIYFHHIVMQWVYKVEPHVIYEPHIIVEAYNMVEMRRSMKISKQDLVYRADPKYIERCYQVMLRALGQDLKDVVNIEHRKDHVMYGGEIIEMSLYVGRKR